MAAGDVLGGELKKERVKLRRGLNSEAMVAGVPGGTELDTLVVMRVVGRKIKREEERERPGSGG